MSIWNNIPDYDEQGRPIAKNTFYNAPSALLWLIYYNPIRTVVNSELYTAQLEAWFRGDENPPTRDNIPGVWASVWLYKNRPETRPYLDRVEGFQNLKKGEPTLENRTFNEKYGWIIQVLSVLLLFAALRWLWSFVTAKQTRSYTSRRFL